MTSLGLLSDRTMKLFLCLCFSSSVFSRIAVADETCPAGGCSTLPVYPECEHSCNERPFIGPDSGNKERIWPECPDGPEACMDCEDKHPKCPTFAAAYGGYGCEDNPSYMIDICAKSCNTCHLRNITARCENLMNAPEALQPGDINKTFKRILNIPELKAEVLSEDPWIVRFPNFLSDEELEFLLNPEVLGTAWKEASDSGPLGEDGRAKEVFSQNRRTGVIWCGVNCAMNPIAIRLRARIGEVVRVHPHYFESLQFLRYTEGQYYKSHHDAARMDRFKGVLDVGKHRIYTFFLYLNDVESGGETTFPKLGISVTPRRGSAILWPSVLDSDPWKVDDRTSHQADVVKAGTKFSMNIWVHLGPHVLAHNQACAFGPIR